MIRRFFHTLPFFALITLLLGGMVACTASQSPTITPTEKTVVGDALLTVPPATIPPTTASYPLPSPVPTLEASYPVPTPIGAGDPTTTHPEAVGALSPDGLWVAEANHSEPLATMDGQEIYTVKLQLREINGSRLWTLVDEGRPYGLGADYPVVVAWSADGQFAYYSNEAVPDGCSITPYYGGLWQVSLADGMTKEILPRELGGGVLAFNAATTRLAYEGDRGAGQHGLVIINLGDFSEQRVLMPSPSEYWQLANLHWSPTESHILVEQVNAPCTPDSATAFALIDLEAESGSVLLPADSRNFTFVAWLDEVTAQLQSADATLWTLDIATGALTP